MKREVKVISLSYSQSQIGSYVVILSEINGFRKLPVVIKTHDAQIIALKIEDMSPSRPTIHDVMRTSFDWLNIDCQEVCIYKVLEGIFYSTIYFSNGIDGIEVDSSCGDAIISSLNFDCPLYVTEEVLSTCGFTVDDKGDFVEDENKDSNEIISLENLNSMMEEAVNNEDFELAAELRDKISQRESEK